MKRYIRSTSLDDIPEEHKHGDCFVVSLHKFMEKPRQYKLVHGVVTGQGPLEGIQYCHAWVEDGDTIIDMTLPKDMQKFPKRAYYAIGDIEITKKYDAEGVYKMINKYGTYGPWDRVFNNYL